MPELHNDNSNSALIRTFGGNWVDVLNPDPKTLFIEDIAHSLSNQCRFSGHTSEFYSVAQHCIHCCDHTLGNRLEALMHDASEAYLTDVSRPVKQHLANYKDIEHNMMMALSKRFGFNYPLSKETKRIDEDMLTIEWEVHMIGRTDQYKLPVYSYEDCYRMFIERWRKYSS